LCWWYVCEGIIDEACVNGRGEKQQRRVGFPLTIPGWRMNENMRREGYAYFVSYHLLFVHIGTPPLSELNNEGK
jgi:hypothetical protein